MIQERHSSTVRQAASKRTVDVHLSEDVNTRQCPHQAVEGIGVGSGRACTLGSRGHIGWLTRRCWGCHDREVVDLFPWILERILMEVAVEEFEEFEGLKV